MGRLTETHVARGGSTLGQGPIANFASLNILVIAAVCSVKTYIRRKALLTYPNMPNFADPTRGQSRWTNRPVHGPRWPSLGCAIRVVANEHTIRFVRFWTSEGASGEQSSLKCFIPCLGRRWTAVKNLTPLDLSSADKSVTVQTHTNAHTPHTQNYKQKVTDISTPCLSACVDKKITQAYCTHTFLSRVVFDSGLFPSSYTNMTSATTRKVHNISQCRQRRTELLPQVTSCTEHLMKFGRVVLEICKQTDKQTDRQTYRHTDHNTSHPFPKRSNYFVRRTSSVR